MLVPHYAETILVRQDELIVRQAEPKPPKGSVTEGSPGPEASCSTGREGSAGKARAAARVLRAARQRSSELAQPTVEVDGPVESGLRPV